MTDRTSALMQRSGAHAATERTAGHGVTDGIDCLLIHHLRVPHSGLGYLAASGRMMLRQGAARLRQVDLHHCPVTDEYRRWQWPGLQLHGSVSHISCWTMTAISCVGHIGVDLQDTRERPGALAFLGGLVGMGRAATIIEFAECEALIKVSTLTNETFSQVRLPIWAPGWRQVDIGYWLYSTFVEGLGAIAVASDYPGRIRWWFAEAPRFGCLGIPQPVDDLCTGWRSCHHRVQLGG